MSIVTVIAVLWLVACSAGLWAWGSAMFDSIRTARRQRRAGENGILEAIAHEAIYRDGIAVIIAGLNAGAALVVLLTEPNAGGRNALIRVALTAGMLAFTFMGVQGRVSRVRIAQNIRRLYESNYTRALDNIEATTADTAERVQDIQQKIDAATSEGEPHAR